MKAMKYRISSEQRRVLQNKVAAEIDVQMRDYLIKYDAMWLWAVAETLGFGKKRLEKLYKAFYDIRRRDKEFFQAEGFEGLLENETVRNLERIGVDMALLATKYGEPVVRTEVK